jgi:hypothetical protein
VQAVELLSALLIWTIAIAAPTEAQPPAAAKVPGPSASDQQSVLIVVGADGEASFGEMFRAWADRWEQAAGKADAAVTRIGGGSESDKTEKSDRELFEAAAAREASASSDTLWIVLIGHGTFDGRSAKFNLRGPDVSAAELATWLKPITRPVVVINCASSSSPFLNALSGPNRIVITATKSGHERNLARFGEHIAAAIADPGADLDKDGQTSVLEAYLLASDLTASFYEQESRLATEHSLLDDNSDGLGTPADWFRGTRAVKTAKDGASADGVRANQICLVRSAQERQLSPEQRQRRDELEFRLAVLRSTKASVDESVYYQRLEEILRPLAELYEQAAQ